MITRLYVNNFRCLENFELSLGGFTSALLVGQNGTGKSTLRLALQMLQSIARGGTKASDIVQKSDFGIGRTDRPLRIELEALIDSKQYRYTVAFEWPESFKAAKFVEESLSAEGASIFLRDPAHVNLTRGQNRTGGFDIDWHHAALPVIQERSETDPLLVFKRWLARMVIIAPIPQLLNGESSDETLEPSLSLENYGDWFSGVISEQPAAINSLETYLRSVMPDFAVIKNAKVGSDTRSLEVTFQGDGARVTLPFSRLSDGEKCQMICGLLLAANDTYGPLTCFWDEPDNFLALSEVSHFVTRLRSAFRNQGQFLATSHNPEVITSFSEENTFVLQRASHTEPPVVRRLSDLNLRGDLISAVVHGGLA